MSIFKFFKKNKEDKNMATLEEVRKAYDELSDEDKKAFSQSLSGHADECGEGEQDGGTEDGHGAEDREQEAPEAEHADEDREEQGDGADGEETAAPEESSEETNADDAEDGWRKEVEERFARLEEALQQIIAREKLEKQTPAPADDATAERLKRAESIYS